MRTLRDGARIPARVVRRVTSGALLTALAVTAAACGSDDVSSDSTASAITTAVAATAVTTTPPSASSGAGPEVTVATASPVATAAVTVASVAPDVTDAAGAPNEAVITVTVGVDSGPDRVESIPLGATVTLTLVNPDSDDEFHAHGYDLGDGMEIPAGQPATFTFVADQAGEFEVESHATDQVLVVLNVS